MGALRLRENGANQPLHCKLLSANLLAGMYANVCHTHSHAHTNPITNFEPPAHKHHDKLGRSDGAIFTRMRSLDSLRKSASGTLIKSHYKPLLSY